MKKLKAYFCLFAAFAMLTVFASAANIEFEDSGELSGIIITELPSTGKLTCGGRLLSRGSAVPADLLELLRYECADGSINEFSYIPVYRDGSTGVAVSCAAASGNNEPPRASNFSVTTYKNATVSGRLPVSDSDGVIRDCRLVTEPKKGRVTLAGGTFVYEPYLNRKGQDSFVYAVCDESGAWSREAEVTVNIERRCPEVEYADIDGKRYEYAAMRLTDEGIYTGRNIGGKYYFDGDDVVSREDFIIMAAMAGGRGAQDVEEVFEEVFADEGYLPDGLTCAQAALIADRVMGISEFAETGSGDGIMTRAEAAELVVEMLNYSSRRTGLFSWTEEM